jgi:hypothetical protein
MKAVLACLMLVFSPCALGADNISFAIVTGVESVQRIRTGENNLPWDRAAPGEVIVSLSCGFARVVYERATASKISTLDDEAESKPWSVLVQLGHYCKLQEFVLDGWHLVAYRMWRGKAYLVDFAEIRVGDGRRLYVDDSRFMEDTGLEAVVGAAARTGETEACAEPATGCPERRIYIDSIPMQSKKIK